MEIPRCVALSLWEGTLLRCSLHFLCEELCFSCHDVYEIEYTTEKHFCLMRHFPFPFLALLSCTEVIKTDGITSIWHSLSPSLIFYVALHSKKKYKESGFE